MPLRRPTLLLRAAHDFVDPFPHVDLQASVVADEPALPGVRVERPATLQLGSDAALSRHVVAYHDALVEALGAWDGDCPGALVQPFTRAIDDVERLVQRALTQLSRSADIPQPSRRRRNLFHRGLRGHPRLALGGGAPDRGGGAGRRRGADR